MPTMPDQDGSFFDSVGVQRPRTGPVGVPRTGGMAAPTSVPPRPPSMPGVGADPGGRPAAPGPAGSGVGAGVAPAPAAPSVQINMPGASPSGPGAPAPAAPPEPAPAPAPSGEPSLGLMPQAALLPKIPSAREMRNYPPGTQLNTPYGPVMENPLTGKRSVKLTPEGQALYARDRQAMKAKLGPNPFNSDPNAPQPKLTPGRLFFDPFTGQYVS